MQHGAWRLAPDRPEPLTYCAWCALGLVRPLRSLRPQDIRSQNFIIEESRYKANSKLQHPRYEVVQVQALVCSHCIGFMDDARRYRWTTVAVREFCSRRRWQSSFKVGVQSAEEHKSPVRRAPLK